MEEKSPKRKISKQWQIHGDVEKIILIYLAYASPPVPIDFIISLTGLSPVKTFHILEDLKKRRFVCDKKESGKGFYYPGDIDLQDYTRNNYPKKELHSIIKKVISFITEFHMGGEKEIITLAELYFQTGINGNGMACIKKAADIFNRSGEKERAIIYYDFIAENFVKKSVIKPQSASLTEDFLDSVFQRVSMLLFYPMPVNKLLILLENAHEIAKRFRHPVHLAKIKLLLGFTLLNGQNRESSRYVTEFWKRIGKITDQGFLKRAFFLTSIFKTFMGRFSEATAYYEKMIGNLETFGDCEDDLISSLLVALSYVSCGRISRGLGMINTVRNKAQKLNLDQIVNYADFMETITLIGIRKIPEAETCLARLWELIEEDGLDYNRIGVLHSCKAFILCIKGGYEGAYEHIKKGFMYRDSMDIMGLHPYCPWIFECLYLLESRGFSDEVVNFNLELRRAINGKNLFLKGVAYRYRALRNMVSRQPQENIRPDLKLSEKYLRQSGAEIELARTRIVMRDYYLTQGKQKLAGSYMDKTWAFLFKINDNLFPNDLLEIMPHERKNELIIEKITSINRSLGTLRNQRALLEKVMSVAMEFTNAMQSGVYIHEGGNLRFIASRNIDSFSLNKARLKLVRESIVDAIKRNKEIIHPEGDDTISRRFSSLGIGSFIGMPIKFNESSSGYFFISNYFGGGPFPGKVLPFMRMFASQIEVGLSNISAYEGIRKLKERFEDEAVFYRREMGLDLPIEQIIGESEGIEKVVEQVRQVSPTNSLVLVTGETGVGKELVAKAIHNLSERKDGPFIPVNLATFPQDLVVSELFGYERGAFTGANERKKGRFEFADGGTIFLDEIGDLASEVQIKLLRVLQEGTFERLGSSTPIRSDFRVIVATNKNLRKEVEKGNFRQDLYYRLNVFPIYVPPLRERKKDIRLLAQHFFSMFNKKLGKKIRRIPAEEFNKLMSYHWPGNVRELKHIIERAVILSNGYEISFSGLEFEMDNHFLSGTETVSLLAHIEREHIEKILKSTFWKISGPFGAASLLGLPPSTLRHRMKKLGIEKPLKGL